MTSRYCLQCDAPIVRRAKENTGDFMARVYCNRDCYYATARVRRKAEAAERALVRPPPNKRRRDIRNPNSVAPCERCFGMPWRVVGSSCSGCGLEHAEEPTPKFQGSLIRSNAGVLRDVGGDWSDS